MQTEVLDDDVDLRQYLFALWRRRVLIVAVTVVAAFVGVAVVWLTPPTYEASVTLARISTLSKIGDQSSADTALSFRALLQNRRLAEQVIKQFSLDKAPYGFTPVSFVTNAILVEDLDKGAMILAKVTLAHSPDLAAKVANRLAEGAVELNRLMNQAEGAAARDFIKKQFDEARTELDGIEGRLIARQQQAQIGAVQADVDAMLSGRRQLLTMSVEIEGEKARLQKAEEELSRRERLLAVPRAVDASAALLDASRQAQAAGDAAWAARQAEAQAGAPDNRAYPAESTGRRSSSRQAGPPEQTSRPTEQANRPPEQTSRPPEQTSLTQERVPPIDALNLRSEFVNPVFEALDYQVATSRTRLASLQEQERRLRTVVHAGSASNPTLAGFYSRQVELLRLETEHDLARRNYSDLSTRYEQARIQVASRTSQLEIIDPAMSPERAVAPRPLRTVAMATVLGLFSGVVVALLIGYLAAGPAPTAAGPPARDRASW